MCAINSTHKKLTNMLKYRITYSGNDYFLHETEVEAPNFIQALSTAIKMLLDCIQNLTMEQVRITKIEEI